MSPLRLEHRLRLFAARLGRRIRGALSANRTTYVWDRVDEYEHYWAEAAALIGASFDELCPGVWEVRRGSRRTRLANYLTECDDPVTLQLAGDKLFGYRLATSRGVPVPEHCVVTSADSSAAERFHERVREPLVVKPAADSSSGLGVTIGVETRAELSRALSLASLYGERVLVERMVPGESYRLLYLDGQLLHAVRRRGLRIRGDGRASIAECILAAGHSEVKGDAVIRLTLAAQSLDLSSVVPRGREVLARGGAGQRVSRELRTVYDEVVTDQCGPALVREGAAIVSALGSEFAGIDLVTVDPSVSLSAAGGAFIEINTTPGIHHHYLEPREATHHVAARVLDYLLSRDTGSASLAGALSCGDASHTPFANRAAVSR